MKHRIEQYDVVVCGGGLAGFCAAVAAARHGAKTCLIQNRPVFGGNSSSEIGVTPHGAAAFHAYARETGILSELLIEERARNHAEIYENGWTNSVWDLVLYDTAVAEPNLTVHLNTNILDVVMAGHASRRNDAEPADAADIRLGYFHRPTRNGYHPMRLAAVVAEVLSAEETLQIQGKIFVDATGDGLVADRAGCEWRMGSESRDEFGEPHAPVAASTDTMGSSIHFRARNVGRAVPFRAPDWAVRYDDAGFFYKQGRLPKEERGGYWWLEIGVPFHTIHDNETIRHELTRHALGVWDWMKNRDPIMAARTRDYALEWIGQVPGKRESRRVMGRYLLTEHDIQNRTVFDDEIAFGGWFVDLHTPGGLLADKAEPAAEKQYDTFCDYAVKTYCGPYGIPLRSMIAKDVDNLMLAGRCASATHAALGTIRVMATTAVAGHAVGIAAAHAIKSNVRPNAIATGPSITHIRQALLRDGCFLPNARNEDPDDLARRARASASSEARLTGAGPDTAGAHEGLAVWRDQPQYEVQKLERRRGQLIALGHEGIAAVRVCLTNTSDQSQQTQAALVPVEHIWDYRADTAAPLAQTTLTVPPGEKRWIDWPVHITPRSGDAAGRFLRLDLWPNPNLSWLTAGCVIPGHVSVYQISDDRMRRYGNGLTMSFEVSPPQSVFGAQQVLTGVTRPHRATNLWRSDPSEPLPQWLELAWAQPQTITQVDLTFPGHLLREYHAYSPCYRDPQCPADYHIEAEIDGAWRVVLDVADNYQRHRRHTLAQPVTTQRLRVVVTRTNGDPSAAIYEVRCYA